MKFYPENKTKVDNLLWYSLKRVLSFCVKFMYLIGGRGYGKTYCVKTFLFNDFIKHGNKFAWFRTTDIALDRIRDPMQFFGRMKNLEELGITSYSIKKDVIYLNGKVAGYLFPIATFHNIKGADYECVNGCWDEFMRAKGERNVPNKREKFLDAVESVFRSNGARIFCISNSTNQFDECLEPFNLTLEEHGCYLFRKPDDAVVHFIQPSKKHIELTKGNLSFTAMSKQEKKMAVQNKFTSYGDYGTSLKLTYNFSLQVDDTKTLGVYTHENLLYIKSTGNDNHKMFTLNRDYVTKTTLKLTAPLKKVMQIAYDDGRCRFENGYCRAMLRDALESV